MQLILRISAILLALGVAAGAFGAHALKHLIPATDLLIWETAVHYHLLHSLAVLVIASFSERYLAPDRARLLGALMIGAICVFSGSLYLLVLLNIRWLGAITPIGGASFIIAWSLLALSIKRKV